MIDLAEMEARIRGMSPAQRSKLAKLASKQLQRAWLPQPGPQSDAYFSEADETLYGGAAGGGKALADDERVVTPFGFRRMGDLKVGDTVCAADGTHTKVIGVYPQGVRPLYRITFQDGVSVLADAEHRWKYSIARKAWRKSGREWKIGTTAQLAQMMDAGARPLIPLCQPLKLTKAYKTPQRVVDPYVLGLLLGDGYTKQNGPGAKWSFASEDPELIAALPGDWVPDRGPNYRLRGAERRLLMAEFARMGLAGCGALTKFIPEPYKWAPAADRLSLLQGLMDTDGTNDDRGHASFTSISRQLADDVAWLVRSLGGRATVSEKVTTGHLAYTVYIRTADSSSLFRLERKRARGTAYQHGDPKRRIESIVYECDAPATCIAVDHPDSLYVVGEGCIVTHNTDLLLGLATTRHERSVIFRRQSTDLATIWNRLMALTNGRRTKVNASTRKMSLADGRFIEFGHLEKPNSEKTWQGNAHDLYGFDEAAQLDEAKVLFVIQWLRSTTEGQRKRVVFATNPPIPEYDANGQLVDTGTGAWLKEWFAPWLDERYPNPAKPGELRWCFMRTDGDRYTTVWVDGPGGYDPDTGAPLPDYTHEDVAAGKVSVAISRTFIKSLLKDNAYLANTGYAQKLSNTPEPLKSLLLNGTFTLKVEDHPFQVIPTQWVLEAQERWHKRNREGNLHLLRQLVLSGDVAQGGMDTTVLASLLETDYFEEPFAQPGRLTPTGKEVAGLILLKRRDNALIVLDGTGGWAGSTRDLLDTHHQITAEMCIASEGAHEWTEDNRYKLVTVRTSMWWQFRQALDPKSPYKIALPPSTRLATQLTTPLFSIKGNQLWVESKDEVRKRLSGASTDEADAVIQAWRYRDQALAERFHYTPDIVDRIVHGKTPKTMREMQHQAMELDDPLKDFR